MFYIKITLKQTITRVHGLCLKILLPTLRGLIFVGTNFRGRKKYRKNRISRELIFAVGPNMIFFQTQIGTVFFQNL